MTCSIITITYNNLSGLRQTVQSVLTQTYTDYEWIIVDGNSTDGTIEYLSQLQHPYLKILSEPDNGVYDAQNKGIRLASGDYCFFLNAGDTFCASDTLARIFHNIPIPSPDIIYGNELIVDGTGRVVEHCRGVENPTFVNLYNSCMKHQASFIRRALFDTYGAYDSSLRICADFDWFFRVIAFHNEVSLCYRDIDISYFENTGLSYHSPDLCRQERQRILDRYMSHRLQQDYQIIGRYSRIVKAARNKFALLLLRVANKILK